jgi:hypothetical protein
VMAPPDRSTLAAACATCATSGTTSSHSMSRASSSVAAGAPAAQVFVPRWWCYPPADRNSAPGYPHTTLSKPNASW